LTSRRNFEKTEHYTNAPKGTKDYDDFWLREYERFTEGCTINGYTITGDHYYFLNYYQMLKADASRFAGQGRLKGFPDFYVAQYEFFHYIELCKRTLKNCCVLKGRGLGMSETMACVMSNLYQSRPNSRSLITASTDDHLSKTLSKIWEQINFCNDKTDGGLWKPLLIDQPKKKKCGVEQLKTRVELGWLSEIEGIIADKPSKVRGDRVDFLFYEEAGSD